MLKSVSDLLLPDPRFETTVAQDVETGIIRPMQIADLHALVRPFALNGTVPSEVGWQFETARNAFIYCWFCYELATLAEGYALGALENGLRKRAEIENKVPRWPSLKKLLAIASDEGWLDPNGFLMPFEAIIMARNHVQHGHPQLFHQFSIMILEVVCQILNALYPNVSAAAPG
jgi:hypothetical protein